VAEAGLKMEDGNIDRIFENMVRILPLLHKRLLRMDLGGVTGNLTRLHLAIMGMLSEGSLTVSELARMSSMPKSQITHLIDKLVKLGVLERRLDAKDRRVINLALTDHGGVLLGELKQKVKQNIKDKLSGLTPDELADMSAALETLKEIGAKL
jgi:DNA-binding MarR family transcriptional regulator